MNDFNPGNQNVSGQMFAQGISGATASVNNLIDTLSDQHKQVKAYRAMAVDGLGMDPDTVGQMGLSELKGTLQGAALKSANAQRAAQMMDLQSQAQERQSIGAYRQSMADRATTESTAMKNFGTMMNDPSVDSTKLTPEQIMQFGTKAGLSAQQLENVARARSMMADGGATGPNQIDTFDLPNGQKGVALRGSKQLNILPNNDGTITAQDVLDSSGQPTGQKIIPHPNGKGFTMIKAQDANKAGLLDEKTVQGYQQMLLGNGNQQGINDQIQQMETVKANAASGRKNPQTNQPYTFTKPQESQLSDLYKMKTRIGAALDAHDKAAGVDAGTGAPAAGAGGAGNTDPKAMLDQANAAIKAGADPGKVKARLKALGINTQ